MREVKVTPKFVSSVLNTHLLEAVKHIREVADALDPSEAAKIQELKAITTAISKVEV